MNWLDNVWVKRGIVVLGGVLVFVLKQYGTTGGIDLQALAMHVAGEIDKLVVGFAAAWLLTEKPDFMRRPSELEESDG
jgi:hypothetical protein